MQLGVRDGLRLLSRVNIRPGNLLADMPLVRFAFYDDGRVDCMPVLDKPGIVQQPKHLQFDRWWNEVILADGPRGFSVSRRQLVVSLRLGRRSTMSILTSQMPLM